jgi:Concanavalin A-like lectin/glucanases superfamily
MAFFVSSARWVRVRRSILLQAIPGLLVANSFFLGAVDAAEAGTKNAAPAAPLVWKLDGLKSVGGQTPAWEGAPKIVRVASGVAGVQFDGKADGLIFPVNPLAGLAQFTVEILFSPAVDGEPEQRFFHAQDEAGRRVLIELRLNKEGEWWLDTFLKPIAGNGLPLIDAKKVHPAGRWYWAALRYDGKTMSSFVNGQKELEGELAFEAMGAGQASVGVRLNRVYWFKGAIREVRFSPVALAPEKLQKSE